ncbi:uncharacterized protein LOC128864725 [Anastrepha ludens]|uniref:uncharacterized protein LOC128864725 n=1 Tax=Anastrepha ludens TaxID=28586 RepID=UPI0023B0F3BE|nr:uncharacterized protein LOC128864725 [Anastrepha ludens]
MNGADPPESNRFRLLDPDLQRPKKRPEFNDFVPLPVPKQNDDHIPRFLVASAIGPLVDDKIRPLSSYNVFQIERGLRHICADNIVVTELRSGDLLLKVENTKSAEKFLKATHIGIIPTKITSHKGLNTTQGRIISRNLINLSEIELTEGLIDQKVIEVKKIMRKEGDKLISTGAAIVTFDLIRRPEFIKLGWERVRVLEHIPNPMRCKTCQRLGHTKNRCRNIEVCSQCATPPPHLPCPRLFCVNCQAETHSSNDPCCPTFLKHKSVNKIKIERRCTIREAWKTYNSNPNAYQIQPPQKNITSSSFAQIVKNTTTVEKTTVNKPNNSQTNTAHKANEEDTNKNATANISAAKKTTSNNIPKSQQTNNTTTPVSPQTPTNSCTTTNSCALEIPTTSRYTATIASPLTPTRSSPINSDNELTPFSQLQAKFPDINVLITPNTYKNSLPVQNTNNYLDKS